MKGNFGQRNFEKILGVGLDSRLEAERSVRKLGGGRVSNFNSFPRKIDVPLCAEKRIQRTFGTLGTRRSSSVPPQLVRVLDCHGELRIYRLEGGGGIFEIAI